MGQLITAIIVSMLRAVFGRSLAPYLPRVMRILVRGGAIFVLVMAIYIVARWLVLKTN
jgi:hypothetical protein